MESGSLFCARCTGAASVSGGSRARHLQVEGARGRYEEGPAATGACGTHRVALTAARTERAHARPHEHHRRRSYASSVHTDLLYVSHS